MARSSRVPARWFAAVALVAILGSACAASSPSRVPSPPPSTTAQATPARAFTVQIEQGLQVDWSPDAAAAATLEQIKGSERMAGRALAAPKILSVEAWLGIDVPREIGEGNMGQWLVVWVVRAEGTFVAFSCPQAPCPSESSGFAMFDDTGAAIGSGFPLPSPEPSPDCFVARPLCLTLVAVAQRYGMGSAADQMVAVRVRPTKVRMCDGIIEPKYDVTFDLRPPAIVTVTVGQLPDGRWEACTY